MAGPIHHQVVRLQATCWFLSPTLLYSLFIFGMIFVSPGSAHYVCRLLVYFKTFGWFNFILRQCLFKEKEGCCENYQTNACLCSIWFLTVHNIYCRVWWCGQFNPKPSLQRISDNRRPGNFDIWSSPRCWCFLILFYRYKVPCIVIFQCVYALYTCSKKHVQLIASKRCRIKTVVWWNRCLSPGYFAKVLWQNKCIEAELLI